MRFWLREILGWLLIGLGLFLFLIALGHLWSQPPRYIESGLVTGIGFIIFRGGIHLLKVAVAARVCLQVQDRPESAKKPALPKRAVAVTVTSSLSAPTQ